MTLWMLWSVAASACIALAGAAVDRAMATFGAPRRIVWVGAMLCATLIPLAAAIRPSTIRPDSGAARARNGSSPAPASGTDVGRQPVGVSNDPADAHQPEPVGATPPIGVAPQHLSRRDRAVAAARRLELGSDRWAGAAWAATSAILIALMLGAFVRLHRRRAHWHDTTVDECRVLVAPDVGPAVVGFARPRVVIPTWVLSSDPSTRSLVLRHEMQHIAAGDPRIILAAGVLAVAMPWNLALWWMLARLRLAIEFDCDARVTRAMGTSGGAREYGLMLLAIGERHSLALPFAAALKPRPYLEQRIAAMTRTRSRRPVLTALPFAAVAILTMTAASYAPRPNPLAAFGGRRAPQAAAPVYPGVTPSAIIPVIPAAAPLKAPPIASLPELPETTSAPTVPLAQPQTIVAQTAEPRGEVMLDSVLRKGRQQPGLRLDSTRFRTYFDGVIGDPFVPILVRARDASLTAAERDTVVNMLTRFERRSDSTWGHVVAYMANLPDTYDLDAAWSQVLGAADSVATAMFADGATLTGLLTSAQLGGLPPDLAPYLTPACAPLFHQRVEGGQHLTPLRGSYQFQIPGAVIGGPVRLDSASAAAARRATPSASCSARWLKLVKPSH